jgi:FO synthase
MASPRLASPICKEEPGLTELIERLREGHASGELPSERDARALATETDIPALTRAAAELRDRGFGSLVTYSRKVFIPLTHLCRDVCHYCTFAQVPRKVRAPYLSIDEVLETARHGAEMGCKEALFTLGEKPELRYKAAREALAEMGFASTLDYLHHAAVRVREETGLMPHLNPGTMTPDELRKLRHVSPSMGIMIESTSERLCEKGMPHYGSPDKIPAVRLETLEHAGAARIPFTTGILIGIGETRLERIESLLAIREIHARHGHVQEIIIQNFRAKADTRMRRHPEPDVPYFAKVVAAARWILGAEANVQVPPNLTDAFEVYLDAGINDWGGVSPVTIDWVNPEAPWPHLDRLRAITEAAGFTLRQRMPVYPEYLDEDWVAPALLDELRARPDERGYPVIEAAAAR